MISCISGTVEGRLEALKQLVRSVRQSVGTLPYEIILVACECSENTLNWIRAQPDCKLHIRLNREGSVIAFNHGFIRQHYDARYSVTLNDDVKVDGETLRKAYTVLERRPEVGQVAFGHRYQNRAGDKAAPKLQRAYGYMYGQCCMTRRWLGDLAGWWGNYGLVHYGGDTHLSLRIWELGYQVIGVDGCSVTDWEIEDETRQIFSHQMRQAGDGRHPDQLKFQNYWKGRMPKPAALLRAVDNRVLRKAARGELRTLRFKGQMGLGFKQRVALLNTFSEYGPAKQANQAMAVKQAGSVAGAQEWFLKVAQQFRPDLVMLQGQRQNSIMPKTVRQMRKQLPYAYVFNWDGDTHYPMEPFHAQIAAASQLQLTISPDLFDWYRKRGAHNIGYWPIGVEQQFLDVDRSQFFSEERSSDVVFLGTLFGEGKFPEAINRRKAVQQLHKSRLNLQLHGYGWKNAGIDAKPTLEEFTHNARMYSQSKMALSISQTKELWGYTSDRAYNIMATGCPILMQRFRGMQEHGMVDGETCIAWSTPKELMAKAHHYVAHPREREAIGAAGKELMLHRHTWKHRVRELFGLISGLGGERV